MGFFPLTIVLFLALAGAVAIFLQYWEGRRYLEALDFVRGLRRRPLFIARKESAVETSDDSRKTDPKFLEAVGSLASAAARREPSRYRLALPHGSALVEAHIHRVAEQNGDFDPRVMCDVTAATERSRFRCAFPNLLIAAALILGLAGTFLAFRSMLIESGLGRIVFNPRASENSAEIIAANNQLLSAFKIIYEHLGHAFYSSLAGIFVTVGLISVRSLWVYPQRDEFFAELEEFTCAKLLPYYGAQGASTSRLVRAAEQAAETVQSATRTSASLEKLSGSLVALTERVETSLGQNSQLGTALGDVSKQLKSTEERWKSLLDSLETSRLNMGKVVGQIQEHSQKVVLEIQRSTDAAATRLDAFAKSTGAEMKAVVGARLEHFDQVNATITATSEKILQSWQQRSEATLVQQGFVSAKLLEQAQATQQSLIAAQGTQFGKLAESLTAHATTSGDTVQKVAGDFLQELRAMYGQREALEQVTLRANAETARLLSEHDQRQVEHLKTFGNDARQVSTAASQAAADARQVAADTHQVAADTRQIAADARQAGAETRQIGTDAREITAAWNRGVAEASATLQIAVAKLIETLEKQRPPMTAITLHQAAPAAPLNGKRPSRFFDFDRSPVLAILGRKRRSRPE